MKSAGIKKSRSAIVHFVVYWSVVEIYAFSLHVIYLVTERSRNNWPDKKLLVKKRWLLRAD